MQHLRERCNAYWLIDLCESYQPQFQNEPFKLWNLEKSGNRAIVEMRKDTGLAALVSQEIPYIDFPLDKFEWYLIGRVLLLKNEY